MRLLISVIYQGNSKIECGAAALLACNANAACMFFNYFCRNKETDTKAGKSFFILPFYPVKALEDFFLVGLADAVALVFHGNGYMMRITFHRYFYQL